MSAMIDLAGVLADPTRSGAYFIDVHDRDAPVTAATQLGFALLAVDLQRCTGKDEALPRIAAGLRFPDWFGNNWDALADCLNDMSWVKAPGYVLLFDHAGDWRDADPEGFATLLEVVNAAATEWARLRTPFWMLIPLASARLDEMQTD